MAGGLKVKALAQTVRDAGLSPAWHYPFPCLYIHSKEKSNFSIIYLVCLYVLHDFSLQYKFALTHVLLLFLEILCDTYQNTII